MRRKLLTLLLLSFALWGVVFIGNDVLRALESNAPSQSLGSTANGRLINGKRLPSSGANYVTYSRLGSFMGRTAVHQKVRDTVLDAYAALGEIDPGMTYIFGETGWPNGGRFRPHKTHQNGLSVDFMVPVRTQDGEPAQLPTVLWNKLGYAVEFDEAGATNVYRIDFEALAAHLHQLHVAAGANGIRIDRVIFAPELQEHLFARPAGQQLRSVMTFSTRPAWVRHDEHYHVDFALE